MGELATGVGRRQGRAWTAALAACALACGPGAARAADPPPVAAYAREPAVSSPVLSPDGARVAYIDTGPAGQRVMILPADAKGGATAIPLAENRVQLISWIDATHLLVVRRVLVSEPPILVRQLAPQGIIFDLTTEKSAIVLDHTLLTAPVMSGGELTAGVYQGRPVLFLSGLAQGPTFNLYAADATTGAGTIVAEGSLDKRFWRVRPDGRVYSEEEFTRAYPYRRLTFRYGAESDWRELQLAEGDNDAHVLGLGPTGQTIVVLHRGGLSEVQPDGALGPPLQPPDHAVTGTGFHFRSGALRYFELSGATPSYVFYDPVLEHAWPLVAKAFANGRPGLMNESEDGRELLIYATPPGTTGGAYWAHMATGAAETLGESYPEVPKALIGPSVPVTLRAGDGLALTGVLTTPAGPARTNLPLVVYVKDLGRPAATPGFQPLPQLLASRGYAVLGVNHRGVSGVSPTLQAAGDGQWGRGMLTDLSDAVAELGRQGLIDPKRVCIAGEDYGGYAALAGVTLQHDVYRCAISIDGVGDLGLALRRPDENLRSGQWAALATTKRLVGPTGDLDALSPVKHATAGTAPVLLMTVGVRPDENTAQARRMRAALTAAGRPVQTVEVRADQENPAAQRQAMWTAMLDFLAKYDPA